MCVTRLNHTTCLFFLSEPSYISYSFLHNQKVSSTLVWLTPNLTFHEHNAQSKSCPCLYYKPINFIMLFQPHAVTKKVSGANAMYNRT